MSADIIFIEGGVMCVLRYIYWNFELKFMATLVRIIRLSVLNKNYWPMMVLRIQHL